MTKLNTKERAYLRSMGADLDPIVYIGKEGGGENIEKALDEALSHHELVKVRFLKEKDQIRELSAELEKATGSQVVATTGFTTLFFRQDPTDPERKYRLPSRKPRG